MSKILPILGFLGTVSLVWGVAHFYVGWRLIRPLGLGGVQQAWLWFLVAALWLLGPLSMALGRLAWSGPGKDVLAWLSFLYMGFFSLLLAVSLGRDLVGGVLWAAGKVLEWLRGSPAVVTPERRLFFMNAVNAGVLGVAAGLTGWGLYEARRTPRVVRVTVPVENLPEGLEGYRIVQLSDVHVGPTIRAGWLNRLVDAVNALKPDALALTGDFVDGHVEELAPHVAPFARLESRDGKFFVTGNHEYYWGAEAWCSHFESLGFQVLHNDSHVIEREGAKLMVAGVPDVSGGRVIPGHDADARKALEGAGACDARVLLVHQPKILRGVLEAGTDLQLSGHTHGGQFFPWSLLVGFAHKYAVGLHRLGSSPSGRGWIYVSRGTGYWGPPNRGGSSSEITEITLVRA